MASVTNLKQGSRGDDVVKLQKALIDAGYNVGGTGADGVLGKNTAAAIKQYQKDNGLAVDGIAGKNTLGKLFSTGTTNSNTGGSTKTDTGTQKANTGSGNGSKPPAAADTSVDEPSAPVTSPGGFTYGDFQYAAFDPMADENIKQAWDILQQNSANRPGEWVDPYLDKYMGYLNQYENRDPFSYDFNSDALYNQYKDQYIQQGQLAMMDTMGQAAAMTGGYGNSYAQSVGQQAYNQQLSQLNEIMPELYGMAYDRYNQEGQDLLTQYSLYKGLSDQSYTQHQDTVDNWYREMSRLTDDYNNLYGKAWDNYTLGYNTALNEYSTDRSEEFSKWQTEQDQTFTSSENQKNRDFTATENQKDRDTKGTTTETKEPKYADFDYEEQQKWTKKFSGATSLEDVENIADDMQDAKIDPEVVARWHDRYAKQFEDEKQPEEPNLTGIAPTTGGGGGGRWYMTVR